MNELTAILIDDERNALEALGMILARHCPEVKVLRACRSADEARLAIEALHPTLLLLDIEMPGKNGFDLLAELDEPWPAVIFVTAFDHYAIEAIRQCAFDYLLKPVDEAELVAAIRRLRGKREAGGVDAPVEQLLDRIRQLDRTFHKVALPTLAGFEFVPRDEILYCRADGNYAELVMTGGTRHLVSRTLRDMHALLADPFFFRAHQSYLINLNHVVRYVRGAGGFVVMADGTQVPVARARKEDLLAWIRR